MDLQNYIPSEIINFFLVIVFSLLVGLGQRRLHIEEDEKHLFGTDRTFTFIGMLGYILLLIEKDNFVPFLAGFIILGLLLGIQYFLKIKMHKNFGLTTSVLALLTYCLPVLILTQPIWLVLSFVVAILIITEMKNQFFALSKKVSEEEFITLAKFIAFAGIILPLLPSKNISDLIPVSPYTIWLAIVVVSGISYISYIIKKFIFPDSGLMLTGLLGGIYSSTATTVILARRENKEQTGLQSVSAIMLANGMMYLRVLVIAYLFNQSIGQMLTIPFLLMFGVAFGISKYVAYKGKKLNIRAKEIQEKTREKNPLELRTATIFGVLFVVFALITQSVMKHYGSSGVTGLAFFIGLFDVDPFLLYLLQQKSGILSMTIVLAVINATNSNNIMKMVYAVSLSSKESKKPLFICFSALVAAGLVVSLVVFMIN